MQAKIAFYVHHHGSGHIMRCLAIARELGNAEVYFLGSNLKHYLALIPKEIICIHLPMDTPTEDDASHFTNENLAGLHYAPINVRGLRLRNAIISTFFAKEEPLLIIIDVSVEIATLARLSGIPSVIVRQHGNRNDIAHVNAYRNTQLLLAPYPEMMSQQEDPEWLSSKTFYTGGFSRFTTRMGRTINNYPKTDNLVCVLVGSGGTSINTSFLIHLAGQCPTWQFQVIGDIASADEEIPMPPNLIYLGNVADPMSVLLGSSVVIGNTGHNTVMEMASLQKNFITIPEDRPFDEQKVKAKILTKLGLAIVVPPENIYEVEWQQIIATAAIKNTNWAGMEDPLALQKTSEAIMGLYDRIYCRRQSK